MCSRLGTVNLVLRDGSRYTWTKATTVVHNLIVGSLWIDNYGDILIQNHTNGYTCPMRFIAHSYFNRGPPKQVTVSVRFLFFDSPLCRCSCPKFPICSFALSAH